MGTWTLIFMSLRFVILSLFSVASASASASAEELDTLEYTWDLEEIKTCAHEHDITINDFLYSLMLAADAEYYKLLSEDGDGGVFEDAVVSCLSLVNVTQLKHANNILPLFTTFSRSMASASSSSHSVVHLFQRVHHVMNACKYSLYFPLLHKFFMLVYTLFPKNTVDIMSFFTDKNDYRFSNLVGPPPLVTSFGARVRNIQFVTQTKGKEVAYNIISYNGRINLVLSFVRGRYDKARWQHALDAATRRTLQPPTLAPTA
jgi:hypothetical protein